MSCKYYFILLPHVMSEEDRMKLTARPKQTLNYAYNSMLYIYIYIYIKLFFIYVLTYAYKYIYTRMRACV